MLRTIQSFALDRLANEGIEADVRRRHAEAYLALATQVSHRLNTSRHSEWLDRMAPEQANLRAAVRWSIDAGEGVLALRLTAALWRFWQAFGQVADGRQLAEEALAMPEAPTSGSDRAWALAAAGSLAYWQADSATARRHYQAQIDVAEAAGDEACIADAYFNFGHVAFSPDSDDEASQLAYIDAAEERYRKLGDERGAARAAWGRGILALSSGQGMLGTGSGEIEEATDLPEEESRGLRTPRRPPVPRDDRGEPRMGRLRRAAMSLRRLDWRSRRSSNPSRCETSGRRRSRCISGCCSAP